MKLYNLTETSLKRVYSDVHVHAESVSPCTLEYAEILDQSQTQTQSQSQWWRVDDAGLLDNCLSILKNGDGHMSIRFTCKKHDRIARNGHKIKSTRPNSLI